MVIGDIVKVFDGRMWQKAGRDVGDNSIFFKDAIILDLSDRENKPREQVATVGFFHDKRISHGHFVWAIQDPETVEQWATLMEENGRV